jgi:hypothetical protein
MKSNVWFWLVGLGLSAALILGISGAPFAQEEPGETGDRAEELSTPAEPRETVPYGGVHYVLSKSRDALVIPPETPETHTVVPGDTLWGISGQYLRDNFMWPIIWEINLHHVPNPHLIFPSQIVILPGTRALPPDDGRAVAERPEDYPPGEIPPEGVPGVDGEGVLPGEPGDQVAEAVFPVIRPAVPQRGMDTCGYIVPQKSKGDYKIIGAEMLDIFQLAKPEVVYVNIGAIDGAKVGERYFVYDHVRKVHHPRTKKFVGWYTNNFGIIELVCVFEKSSMAVITDSFEPIHVGNLIAPYAEIPSPWLRDTRLTKCSRPTKRITGYVIDTKLNPTSSMDGIYVGEGDVVYIDLGLGNNVSAGDYFLVYIESPEGSDMPEVTLGELIVLRSSEATSSCFVTKCTQEIELGRPVDYVTISDMQSGRGSEALPEHLQTAGSIE